MLNGSKIFFKNYITISLQNFEIAVPEWYILLGNIDSIITYSSMPVMLQMSCFIVSSNVPEFLLFNAIVWNCIIILFYYLPLNTKINKVETKT